MLMSASKFLIPNTAFEYVTSKLVFRILKKNSGAMYTYFQNGTLQKKKPHPENANYQVQYYLFSYSALFTYLQAILPVRALLLKKLDIKKYKALLALQSHRTEREEMGKTEVLLTS